MLQLFSFQFLFYQISIEQVIIIGQDSELVFQHTFSLLPSIPAEIQFLQASITQASTAPLMKMINNTAIFAHIKCSQFKFHIFAKIQPQCSVMAVLSFLEQSVLALNQFIPDLSASTAKDQTLLLTELYDLMCPNGYIETTDYQVLKLMVFTENSKNVSRKNINKQEITIQATKQSNYRPTGLHYDKNEVYVDLNEQLSCQVDELGQQISAHVYGEVILNTKLSGTPDCTITLNDRLNQNQNHKQRQSQIQGRKESVLLDDVQFHHCVKLSDFQESRKITFCPPDGKCQLMQFRISNNITNPFTVKSIVQNASKTRLVATIKLFTRYDAKLSAEKVFVQIPAPKNLIKANLETINGKAKMSKTGDCVEWRMVQLAGNTEYQLRLEYITDPGSNSLNIMDWQHGNILLHFSVEMFTASGIEITGLQIVSAENYPVQKWVRCKCLSGQYSIKW